jgi:hypothetical protein
LALWDTNPIRKWGPLARLAAVFTSSRPQPMAAKRKPPASKVRKPRCWSRASTPAVLAEFIAEFWIRPDTRSRADSPGQQLRAAIDGLRAELYRRYPLRTGDEALLPA